MILFQTINGLVFSALLFLIAAGLSLIFGLMNVINVAHGSFFMLGAYCGLSMLEATGNFWPALLLAPIPAIAIGVVMERFFLRRLYNRGHLDQVLLTFGFTYVFVDVVKLLWGNDIRSLPVPDILDGGVEILGLIVPKYRLFIIICGFGLGFVLMLLIDRSRLGAMVRAGVDDAVTAVGIGINVPLLFSGVFALGVGLAAVGGVIAAPVMGLYPGMDVEILIPAFIVIVIGGMGSLRGSLVGSLLIGMADTFGKAFMPETAMVMVYLVMAATLLLRPQGLFGVKRSA
jgi:branched-subunit amino acid ABC-type transport system permease component